MFQRLYGFTSKINGFRRCVVIIESVSAEDDRVTSCAAPLSSLPETVKSAS